MGEEEEEQEHDEPELPTDNHVRSMPHAEVEKVTKFMDCKEISTCVPHYLG